MPKRETERGEGGGGKQKSGITPWSISTEEGGPAVSLSPTEQSGCGTEQNMVFGRATGP